MTRRILRVLAFLALAGCIPPRGSNPLQVAYQNIVSEKDDEYEEGFRQFMNAGSAAVPGLRSVMTAAAGRGYPMVAILYVAGIGDEVPLELRARHLARFEWPRGQEEQNAIIVPYVRHEIERDLVRIGRPALRLLREALEEDAVTEAKAMQVVGVMLRIGGRGAADELASLLDRERDAGGVRVCDAAAAALLYLGRQDLRLRAASREGLVRSAREWWERAKDQPETEWTASAAAALADRAQPKDIEGVRDVLELLVGETIDDPKEWRAKNPDWKPAPPPVHPESLLGRLSGSRASAFAANRALEEATGVRLYVPPAARLGDLCAAIRLWQPPRDLELGWRRYLESRTLRMTIAVVGARPEQESNQLLWHYENHSNCVEEPTGKLEFSAGDEGFLLYARSLEHGTKILYGEYHESETDRRTVLREFPTRRPIVLFSPSFKACVVISIEDVPGRRVSRPPEELFAETRRRLRKLAQDSTGDEQRRSLRALGYCQDASEAPFLREHQASEALLISGESARLEGSAHLEPYEIEMGLRRAQNPEVRAYLESLKEGSVRR